MKKEAVFAIFAGILIGLGFAFGSWKVVKQIKKPTLTPISSQIPSILKDNYLTINKIENYFVVGDDFILSGEANPNSMIVAITPEADYFAKTSENGTFEMNIKLTSLLNDISITSINDNGKLLNQKYMLIYDKSLGNSQENMQSYVGTVTDIATETIQIKDVQGSIKQININDQTTYQNSLKKNVNIKFTDLAIGDYIVTLGQTNDKKVLLAQKVIISSPIEENKNNLIKGKIETIDKKSITVIDNKDQKTIITLPKKWNGPEIEDIQQNDDVIVTGSLDDKNIFSLRSLHSAVQ